MASTRPRRSTTKRATGATVTVVAWVCSSRSLESHVTTTYSAISGAPCQRDAVLASPPPRRTGARGVSS
eukprot:4287483-Prorocentrum_lima.AAC.1